MFYIEFWRCGQKWETYISPDYQDLCFVLSLADQEDHITIYFED